MNEPQAPRSVQVYTSFSKRAQRPVDEGKEAELQLYSEYTHTANMIAANVSSSKARRLIESDARAVRAAIGLHVGSGAIRVAGQVSSTPSHSRVMRRCLAVAT